MDIDRLQEKAKDIVSFSAKVFVAYKIAETGVTSQTIEAADISTTPETSNVYVFPTQLPLQSYEEELNLNVELQTNPTPPIPTATATPTEGTNVRSVPDTKSNKNILGTTEQGMSLTVKGFIHATDGFDWYYTELNGQKGWVRQDRVHILDPENLPDLGTVAQISVADENGNPTSETLITTQVDLAQTKWIFDTLQTKYSFPSDMFVPSSLTLLTDSEGDSVFQQLNDIRRSDGGINEAKSILAIETTPEGVAPVFFGPGQVTDFVTSKGINIDPASRTLRRGNVKGSVVLSDGSGDKALVDYKQIGKNLLGNQSAFTDSITLLPPELSTGVNLTDMGNGKFVSEDGTVYEKQSFSSGIYEIKKTEEKILNPGIKASPEDQAVLEVAKFNPDPQAISSDGTYTLRYSENYLHDILQVKNISIDDSIVQAAKEVAISEPFAQMNQRLAEIGKPSKTRLSQVTLGAYTNGVTVPTNPKDSLEITGIINGIDQYVVTDAEFAQIVEKIRSNPNAPDHIITYDVSSPSPVQSGIVYFASDGKLHLINRPGAYPLTERTAVGDGLATAYYTLVTDLPWGEASSNPVKISTYKLYEALQCDVSAGCPTVPSITKTY